MNHSHSRRLAGSVALLAALVASTTAARAADDENGAKEQRLLETLRSDAPPAEKAMTCKHLAVYGTSRAVDDLAQLLTDEHLASWSRIALEAIPGPEASEALRKALDTTKGKLLVGTINSIGVRRDELAVDPLSAQLRGQDADAASAAAVALGKIGNASATKNLLETLPAAPADVRSAVAEGCILCAERLLAAGKTSEAAEIYDAVRRTELPKQKLIEATRGAILARGSDGVPLLLEQLHSDDLGLFRLGLITSRELAGSEVADALVAEASRAAPDRAALLLVAFADRDDASVTPAVLEIAQSGPPQVRIAALGVVGRLGDVTCLPPLLEIAAGDDALVAQAAKDALADLSGDQIASEILSRLPAAEGKMLPVLIELIGKRRIDARPALMKALEHADPAVRGAALAALGATVGPDDLSILVSQVVSPQHSEDAQAAQQALREASVRMPDREACAAELAAAMADAPQATKPVLLEIVGSVGGAKALATIGDSVKRGDEALQDTGTRVLGEWMTLDAAPVLLDLAKSAPGEKYQIRALRGYIRLARQFNMPARQRLEMCTSALAAARRTDERQLVLAVLERYPSPGALQAAIKAAQAPELKEDATRAVLVILQKLGPKAGDPRKLLAKVDLEPVKVEIIKAQYGAGAKQKDVTGELQQLVGNLPLITLPSPSYNASFGGDPTPGTPKQLTVKYRINGKAGEASFPENATVMLPMPQ